MATRQLQIIVEAKDNASGALRSVGDSAGGLSNKLSSLDSLTDTARGFKSNLKTVKTLAIAYEVIPVAIDAVKAAYATLGGSAEEAATGQRALFDSIKSFPIIGRIVGPAAEYLSGKLAHLFGRQSTAEVEADMAERKRILTDFATTATKLADDTGKLDNEAALIGLVPSDAAVEKAKQKYKAQIAELNKARKAIVEAAGQGQDVSVATEQLKRGKEEAARIMQAELVEASVKRAKELVDAGDFREKLVELTRTSNDTIAKLNDDAQARELETDNGGYEARALAAQKAADNEIELIERNTLKKKVDLQKQRMELQPLADSGNFDAINRIEQIDAAQRQADVDAAAQTAAQRKLVAANQYAARDDALRQARLDSLGREAQAGDAIAKVELDRLTTSRALEAQQRALKAISVDATSTDEQRLNALREIARLNQSQVAVIGGTLERDRLAILERQAALGSETASVQIQQLQATRERKDLEAQLNGILHDQHATTQQRVEAQRQLASLSKVETQAVGNGVRDATLFVLQQEALLGDRVADQQLKKIQLEKQYGDVRAKLLATIQSEAATEKQKADARKVLAGIDATEARALQKIGDGEKQPVLATLESSQFLSGVTERFSQERDQFEPIVSATKEHAAITQQLLTVMSDYVQYQKGKAQTKVPLK